MRNGYYYVAFVVCVGMFGIRIMNKQGSAVDGVRKFVCQR